MNKKILTFLGITKVEELLGKNMKVTFYHSGDEIPYSLFFVITSFTSDKGQLSFPPVTFGQGGRQVQVSVFSDGGYHISITRTGDTKLKQESYFYKGDNKEIKSIMLYRGTIQLI